MLPFRGIIFSLVAAVALAVLMPGCGDDGPETPLKEAAKPSKAGDQPQLIGDGGPVEYEPAPAPAAKPKIAQTPGGAPAASGRPHRASTASRRILSMC